ncbi:uncharacterized protein LOC129333886 [Eublepharis macularius]|uniref:Uncharacterized protein LOC129333886 n=1 Tax=Eublepharis macularius TaxID=481883 RepID=A0AA97L4N3_EUBMA|nr:uncharacterized protein LOC129333886 [Eublepharis macularius]XP_054841802.1 uncharacterized protein LOC129333886 [Eublepharis macularius]
MAQSGDRLVKRGISWRHREIMDLLHFWGEEKIQEALKNTHRNLDYFERISEQMATRGHRRSALECRSKTKTMRLEYKKVVAHNGRSGNAPITCPYYRELESILRGDASVKPKRLARSMILQVMGQVRPEPLVLQAGSEELFSHELETINVVDIRMSSPCHSGMPNNTGDENNSDVEHELDVTPDGLLEHETSDVCISTPTDVSEKENNRPSPGANSEGTPTRTMVELSPGTRLARIRSRKRGGSAIHNAADRFLTQASEEHQEEMEHRRREQEETRKWREEEGRRHNDFLLETRMERQMFQEAWSENIDVMRSCVGTLRELGNAITRQQQQVSQQLVPVTVQECSSDLGRKGAPKRSCVGKARDRFTP